MPRFCSSVTLFAIILYGFTLQATDSTSIDFELVLSPDAAPEVQFPSVNINSMPAPLKVEPFANTNIPSRPVSNNMGSECPSYFNNQECLVLKETNRYRISHGLSSLRPGESCSRLAKEHTQNMINQRFFDHRNFSERIRRHGLTSGSENIAMGQMNASQVVRDWMNSPGHRRNILDPRAKFLGVGQIGTHWTQCFSF